MTHQRRKQRRWGVTKWQIVGNLRARLNNGTVYHWLFERGGRRTMCGIKLPKDVRQGRSLKVKLWCPDCLRAYYARQEVLARESQGTKKRRSRALASNRREYVPEVRLTELSEPNAPSDQSGSKRLDV